MHHLQGADELSDEPVDSRRSIGQPGSMSARGERGRALRRVGSNRSLRRLLLAFAAFRVAEFAVWITITAYAFQVGGVNESAAVLVAQLVPAALFALTVGALINRFGATRVQRSGFVVQAIGLTASAVVLAADGPALWVYAGAVVAAVTVTVTRPCLSVLAPPLVDGVEELTASNVVVGFIDGGAGLIGPAIAALLMTFVGVWAAVGAMAIAAATAAVLVWSLPQITTAIAEDEMGSVLVGIRTVLRTPGPRVLVLGIGVHSILIGALDLLAVVMAVDLLGRNEAFAGWVTASFGAGMALTGVVAIAVIGRERLAFGIVGSAIAAGVSLVAVSFVGDRVGALLLLVAACGLAASWYELTSKMLLQRVSRLDLLGHVFCCVEAMQMAMLAVGSASVPFLVRWFGADGAPAGVGALMVVTIAVLTPALIRIDRHARVPLTEMAALRGTRLFGPLPAPALETLAREAHRRPVPAGTVLIREGELGAEYFAMLSGRVQVTAGGKVVNELARGEGFGERALLYESARSATVHALEDSVVLVVDRPAFLTAVTGHGPTGAGAAAIAEGWTDDPLR